MHRIKVKLPPLEALPKAKCHVLSSHNETCLRFLEDPNKVLKSVWILTCKDLLILRQQNSDNSCINKKIIILVTNGNINTSNSTCYTKLYYKMFRNI